MLVVEGYCETTLFTKVFIDFSQTTDDVYEDSEDCNLANRTKVLKVFHDVIADMGSYKKLCPCN